MTPGKRLVLLAGLAIAVGAGALALYRQSDTGSPGTEKAAGKGKGAAKGAGIAPVSVAAAVQRSVPVRLQAIGNVEAYSSVAIKSRVDGQILEVHFREGQEVNKGDILFRIDPRPFEAALRQSEAQALRDVASRDQAASQERRYLELLEKNFVSKDAYAQYRTNAQTAEATSKASQAALENARLNLEYTVIRAPINGFVGRALLQAGNMVKANDTAPLVVINQVKPVYVSFAIPEQQLATVRELMRKNPLSVEVAAPGTDKRVAGGRIAFLDNAVDQSTGTIKARAIFDNPDAVLWPGQFYTVFVKLFVQEDAIVVPSRALQTGPNGQFVYVVRPDMTAEIRRVVVARTDGDFAVLADRTVAPGDKVVVRGALRLAPGAKVNVVEEGAAS